MSVGQRKIRLTTALLAALALCACGGSGDTGEIIVDGEDQSKSEVDAISLQNSIPAASVGFGTTPSLPPSDHTFEGKHSGLPDMYVQHQLL